MASRTQRTRQRNETRRKNRKAQRVASVAYASAPTGIPVAALSDPATLDAPCRDPLLASLGMAQTRADELLAEGLHAAGKPCVLLVTMPKPEPTLFGLKAGRYSDPDLGPGFIDFAEDE